ncbi:MAG: hypothetical protein IPM48_08820 [Saprospiraceae bacterium]|nr:hypothetical protein [Saprospiraceae bacterium]
MNAPKFEWILLFILLSCRPESNDSTAFVKKLFPLPYFPAFPGSWWAYDNGDTMRVAPQMEAYIFNSSSYTAPPDFDTLILPKLLPDGIYNLGDSVAFVREYGISKSSQSGYRDPAFKQILALRKDEEFVIGGAFAGHRITGMTIAVDTSLVVRGVRFDSVIVCILFDEACRNGTGGSAQDCSTQRDFYAKNIGLIKRDSRTGIFQTPYEKEFELVDYFIGK